MIELPLEVMDITEVHLAIVRARDTAMGRT